MDAIQIAAAATAPPPGPVRRLEEAALVERARTGDAGAFAELVRRYRNKLLRIARQITRNSEDAEDVLQETLLAAYLHLSGFQSQASFYTWLVRIAINQSLMRLRRRRSDPSVSLDEAAVPDGQSLATRVRAGEPSPEQTFSQREIGLMLERASRDLPEILRRVFILRDIEEFSERATAAALGVSIPAVKSRLMRARLRLRDRLGVRYRSYSRAV